MQRNRIISKKLQTINRL